MVELTGMFQPWMQRQPFTSTPRARFPEKLRGYVRRTFENCRLEVWAEVEVELKRIIIEAFNDQVVLNLDWDEVPLPHEVMATKANRHVSAPDPDVKAP